MLLSLTVRNVVLIDDLNLDLHPGFTVVTGETGAGKSALVGAFSLLLGQRGGKELVRRGAQTAEVSALFRPPDDAELRELLEGAGAWVDAPEGEAPELLLRRVIGEEGRSRAYVNAVPVPLKLLADVAGRLLAVTSQHEHVRLLEARSHAPYLDRFGGCQDLAARVAEGVRRLRQLEARVAEVQARARQRAERLELLRFQAAEIDEAQPREGEDEALEARARSLRHVEELKRLLHAAQAAVYEDDQSLYARVGAVAQPLRRGVALDPRIEPLVARLDALRDDVRDIALDLERAFDALEDDPEALQIVEERLDRLNALRFKYGRTLPDVLAYRAQIEAELEGLGAEEAGLDALRAEVAALRPVLEQDAGALSARRRQAAVRLAAGVMEGLALLQMPEVRVEVTLTPQALGEEGAERVGFEVETNPGEGLRPLREVASGGELSRVLLAVKRVLADAEPVPVHLFDEVDAGISQAVALKVGLLLAEVARAGQVIAITHHPHIARAAAHHLLVEKVVWEGRAHTRVRALDEAARVDELARMLGGAEAGLPVREQASLLLGTGRREARP